MPEMTAGWIVSGAADPAVSGNDQGRNFCAYGIWDIAAGEAVAAADGVSRAAAIAVAIAVAIAAIAIIVTPAAETPAAIVAANVTAKENADATAAAVESGEAAAMKAGAVKVAGEAASCASWNGEQDHQQREKRA